MSTPDEAEEVSSPSSDATYVLAFISNALPIFTVMVATTILYRGRDIFLPLTMAVILAVIFNPISNSLEPYAVVLLAQRSLSFWRSGWLQASDIFLQRSLPLSQTKCPDIPIISATSSALSKRPRRHGYNISNTHSLTFNGAWKMALLHPDPPA